MKRKTYIYLHAIPYAVLISSLTFIGLFLGFTVGKRFGGDVFLFAFSAFLTFAGFAAGLALSYFCLLYTSPSPRDRTRSRMPSSA